MKPEEQIKIIKEALQDALLLAEKYKNNMGIIDQEELSRLKSMTFGTKHNPADWILNDYNGEQAI